MGRSGRPHAEIHLGGKDGRKHSGSTETESLISSREPLNSHDHTPTQLTIQTCNRKTFKFKSERALLLLTELWNDCWKLNK